MMLNAATPYPEINGFLHDLLEGARAALGERLVALYLSGSLALGDFMPHRSDIDFLAVTEGELPPDVLQKLQEMHRRLATSSSRWAHRVEGSYFPRGALRRYDASNATHPNIEAPEEFPTMKWHWTDSVIHRYIVREHGVVLFGPDPRTLVDPVSADDLRYALLELMRSWWAPMRTDSTKLKYSGYQAYAVLTMCRVLYTMEHGEVVSKPVAARWALSQPEIAKRWSGLIEHALAWSEPSQEAEVEETQALIDYTLRRSESIVR